MFCQTEYDQNTICILRGEVAELVVQLVNALSVALLVGEFLAGIKVMHTLKQLLRDILFGHISRDQTSCY